MQPMLAYLSIPVALAALTLSCYAGGHAMLNKRDPRAAWGWIAVSFLLPFLGVVLYFVMGVNRVETRAHRMRPPVRRKEIGLEHIADARHRRGEKAPGIPAALQQLARTADVVTRRPLLDGNQLRLLFNGEQAYPPMLAAIQAARESVLLATYIFDIDEIGKQFGDALAAAAERGVCICVLVDGYAELSWTQPRASRYLAARGVKVARFHPPSLLPPSLHINLRNHRKLLIVDGEIAYTGGMNIGQRHMADDRGNPNRETDVHCELRGPIVRQLNEVFAEDWRYSDAGDCPCPQVNRDPEGAGAICRVITDGPNEDLGQLTLVLLSALACAEKRVRIMTPYFLPPRELVAAMQSAAIRGVVVEVYLPSRSDQDRVHWAMQKMLDEVVRLGVRIYTQAPPFAHSKLLVVDGEYAHIGSANMDPRSLRLNFELMVEVYDRPFAQALEEHLDAVRSRSRMVRLEELTRLSLGARLRNAFWWLFSPYL